MNKRRANLEKKHGETSYLSSEILWGAAQLIDQEGLQVSQINAESAPQEMLGLAIGILRRRKQISRFHLAQSIGCTVDELVALETGWLPRSEYVKYLPLILSVIGLPEQSLQPFLTQIKYA